MMSNISKQARVLLALVCVVLTGTLLSTCGTDRTTKEITDIWEAYLVACRAGDEELARSFYTPESQEYFELDSVGADYVKRAAYEVIKVEPSADYIRMQVVVVRDSVAVGQFKYFVNRDNRYLLQYPCLIFASDWPVTESEHFRVHCLGPYFDAMLDSADTIVDTITPDTVVLEAFYDTMAFITGTPYPKRIACYHSTEREEMSRLCGQRGAMGLALGSCFLSLRRHDKQGMAMVMMDVPDKPIQLLRRGLDTYEDFQLKFPESGDQARVWARYVEQLMDHPLLITVADEQEGDSRELVSHKYGVAGAFVHYLLSNYSIEKFAQLYQHSQTEQAFRDQLVTVYGKTLEEFENILIEEYRSYFTNHTDDAGGEGEL